MGNQDGISRARNELRTAKWRKWLITAIVTVVIFALGLLVSPFSIGDDSFRSNFAVEMIGAGVTFIIINVVFQRFEEDTARRVDEAIAIAAEDKKNAQLAAAQARTAQQELQTSLDSFTAQLETLQTQLIEMEQTLKSEREANAEIRKRLGAYQFEDLKKAASSLAQVMERNSPELQWRRTMRDVPRIIESFQKLRPDLFENNDDSEDDELPGLSSQDNPQP